MNFIDYYKILGIDKKATASDIKKAYRKQARKYHPDLNPNDADAKKNFQQINEANAVLSDPEKRKKYDKYGKDWQHAEHFENAKQHHGQSSDFSGKKYSRAQSGSDFSDFFESMFGGSANNSRSRQAKFRGEDYYAQLQLKLTDAYKTHKQTLSVNGRNIRITIPAGIENGQTIKIAAHGGPGINGGPNGDLYITFSIANHPGIKRLGNDLYTHVDIELYTAVLGGEITVDTLSGKVKLKVKPETQNGSKVKLKGKGFPVYKKDEQFGDLYITYSVKIPTHLTEKQKAYLLSYQNLNLFIMKATQTDDLIAVNKFCDNHKIESSFINLLQQNGLIEMCIVESKYFIEKEQLPQLEKFVRFYYDLDINLEGIETISYLLKRIENLQKEIVVLKNRLRFYEE